MRLKNPFTFQPPRDGARSVGAGWSSPVARQAHNLKVAGSNPAPATNKRPAFMAGFFVGFGGRPDWKLVQPEPSRSGGGDYAPQARKILPRNQQKTRLVAGFLSFFRACRDEARSARSVAKRRRRPTRGISIKSCILSLIGRSFSASIPLPPPGRPAAVFCF